MATMQLTLHRRSWGPLTELGAQLLAEPGRSRLAIAVMDVTPSRPDPFDPGRPLGEVTIRHLAAISDDADRRIGRMLLRREYERLADRPVLPWQLEQDLDGVLQATPIREKGHDR
jgi:hypothetical protein